MKKLLYIGAMSALLLTACGEEKAEETNTAQEESDKAKEKEAEQAKKEEERKVKEAEEKALAEQKVKEEAEKKAEAEKEITVSEAKEIIEYSGMGENDKLISLTVENGEIKAVIDLAPNRFNLPPEDIAVSMYSQASDALLEEEGWNTLTIEYVDVGTVSIDISEKESNEIGMYYFPVAIITERLK
ncbi:hypothetical protein ACFTQ7_12820 [Lysinibacillus sp. NPDC056959]|uniref:hypothetical protein n=1 Tax=Lysinibacillus sp. NPDC056959 TaxID=3345981 RepID=UPI00362F7E94